MAILETEKKNPNSKLTKDQFKQLELMIDYYNQASQEEQARLDDMATRDMLGDLNAGAMKLSLSGATTSGPKPKDPRFPH